MPRRAGARVHVVARARARGPSPAACACYRESDYLRIVIPRLNLDESSFLSGFGKQGSGRSRDEMALDRGPAHPGMSDVSAGACGNYGDNTHPSSWSRRKSTGDDVLFDTYHATRLAISSSAKGFR